MVIAHLKAALDPYVLPFEGPLRAFNSGNALGYWGHQTWNMMTRGVQNLTTGDPKHSGFVAVVRIVSVFAAITTMKRQKIFEGTQWETPLKGVMSLHIVARCLGWSINYYSNMIPAARFFVNIVEPIVGLVSNLAIMALRCRKEPITIIFYGLGMITYYHATINQSKLTAKVSRLFINIQHVVTLYTGDHWEKVSSSIQMLWFMRSYITVPKKF